jgi:hypothetical protein
MDLAEKALLIYRQRATGFTNAPDQIVPMPPGTAWVALGEVDANPGVELVISTAQGILYSRQNGGRFESERRTLIAASQVFTNSDFPSIVSLTTNSPPTNAAIPVVSATQSVLYRQGGPGEWSAEPPVMLHAKPASWLVEDTSGEWAMAAASSLVGQVIHPSFSLSVVTSFRSKPDRAEDKSPEEERLQRFREELRRGEYGDYAQMTRVDVDGDGRKDVVMWQSRAKLDFKTDIFIFLRGPDGQLPERPTQTMHCRGFPIPIGPAQQATPVADLNGDGVCEMALSEPAITFTAPSELLSAALSRGMDWSLTIRPFEHGRFASDSPASVKVKTFMPFEDLGEWLMYMPGDFNGDGRIDLLVRRGDTQWEILFSTADGHWIGGQPAVSFDTRSHGYFEVKDLNGDGRADIIWHEAEARRLGIFLMPRGR